jgi:hypothetical protein
MWHNITDRVTNVAGQVTSTVKELAVEVLDNEREIRAEEKVGRHDNNSSTNHGRQEQEQAPASAPASRLDSLKSRIEQDRSRSNKQHELLERIRAARQASSAASGTATNGTKAVAIPTTKHFILRHPSTDRNPQSLILHLNTTASKNNDKNN